MYIAQLIEAGFNPEDNVHRCVGFVTFLSLDFGALVADLLRGTESSTIGFSCPSFRDSSGRCLISHLSRKPEVPISLTPEGVRPLSTLSAHQAALELTLWSHSPGLNPNSAMFTAPYRGYPYCLVPLDQEEIDSQRAVIFQELDADGAGRRRLEFWTLEQSALFHTLWERLVFPEFYAEDCVGGVLGNSGVNPVVEA